MELYPYGGKYPKTADTNFSGKKVYLKNNGDYFSLVANIGTIDSQLSKNVNTQAKFGWTFNIYYSSNTGPTAKFVNFGPSINYKSNVQ